MSGGAWGEHCGHFLRMHKWGERVTLLLILIAWISILSLYSSTQRVTLVDQDCVRSVPVSRPSPSLSPSPPPRDAIRSDSQCFELPDMSGGCVIQNLYYSNEDRLYLVTDHVPVPLTHAESATMCFEDMYRLPFEYPVPLSKWVPYADNTISREAYLITPDYLETHFQVIPWPGTSYLVNPVYETTNPYYFPKDYNQLWEVGWYEEWHSRFHPLPAMDWLIPGHYDVPEGWQQGMMDFLLSSHPQSHTLFRGALKDMGVGQGTLLRLEQAVFLSDKPHYWSGHAPAAQFRTQLKEFLAPPPSDSKAQLIIPVRSHTRSFLNLRQVMALASYYSIPTHVFTEEGDGASLRDQASETGIGHVRLLAHGGGEANNMFTIPGSSLIEVFPYGMRNQLFEREAQFLGLHYQAIYSWIKPPMESAEELYAPWYYQRCQNSSNYEHNLNTCIRIVKNQVVWVPIRELEEAILTAFAIQGVDLRPLRRRRFVDYLQQQEDPEKFGPFYENDPYRSENFGKSEWLDTWDPEHPRPPPA